MTMASEPDRLILTARERQVLADLEAALHLEAPDLEASLSGDPRRHASRRINLTAARRRLAGLRPAVRLALSAMSLLVGVAVMIASFTRWVPVALLGVALQGVGLWGLVHAAGGRWGRRTAAG